jgi:leader peptidase (prepilin peptidase)/N-methyltransferase
LVISLFLFIFITNDNFGLIFLKSLITLNLIFIALIDHEHKVIPLSSLLFLTIFAIVLSQQTNILNLSELFVTLISGLILLSLRWFYLKFKNREGLGLGDVILFPILTLMVPMNMVPILLLTASLLGIVEFLVSTKLKKDSEIAFGSHLSIAGYLGLINFYPILQINFF